MRDVVPVPDVDHFAPVDLAHSLEHRERVGHYLARVVVVGQAVDDRRRRVFGEFQDVGVREEARHDDVVVAGDDAGDVLGGLALSELDGVRAEVDGVAAELVKALAEIILCGQEKKVVLRLRFDDGGRKERISRSKKKNEHVSREFDFPFSACF